VSHREARLTLYRRRLLVLVSVNRACRSRARESDGISRQCAHRWDARFHAGLVDRSSRPHRMPTRTSREVEALCSQLEESNVEISIGWAPSSVYTQNRE
jgi:hypothetical protein